MAQNPMAQNRDTPESAPGPRRVRRAGPPAGDPAAMAAPVAPLALRRWIWLAAWPVTAVFVLSNAATPHYALWQKGIGLSKGP